MRNILKYSIRISIVKYIDPVKKKTDFKEKRKDLSSRMKDPSSPSTLFESKQSFTNDVQVASAPQCALLEREGGRRKRKTAIDMYVREEKAREKERERQQQ